ncbi:MAG: peptidase S41, partial [Bacteroidales bacterium]|nr:peptidase S41 [Bacteroidales bacterium]
KQYANVNDLKKYLDNQGLLDKFIAFAEKNGVKRDARGIKVSGGIIDIQLKAYIARNMLDNKGFYPIWKDLDTTLKYAVDYLNKKKT